MRRPYLILSVKDKKLALVVSKLTGVGDLAEVILDYSGGGLWEVSCFVYPDQISMIIKLVKKHIIKAEKAICHWNKLMLTDREEVYTSERVN